MPRLAQLFTRQATNTPWYWDPGISRYRDSRGRLIARKTILQLSAESISASQEATSLLASYVNQGVLNTRDWKRLFREEIKDEFGRQYLVGIGGRQNMTPSDWGRYGAMLKKQYAFLENFEGDLANLSEAQIRARMNQYLASAHQANEVAHAQVAKKWGADQVEWDLDDTAQHCGTCPRRASMGPQPIGDKGGFYDSVDGVEAFPGDGQSECLNGCRCGLKFSNSQTGETFEG